MKITERTATRHGKTRARTRRSRWAASIRSLIVTRPIVPATFRKLDAVAVLTGPLLPAPRANGNAPWCAGPLAQPLPAPVRYQHLLEGVEVLNAFARAEHD